MKNLFIDTNIWLSLYHFSNDDLTQFAKLKDMLGKSIKMYLPQQVCDEIERNREAKLQDALKNFEINEPKYPAFTKGYNEYEELRNDTYLLIKRFKSFKENIESQILSRELPADIVIDSFISTLEHLQCNQFVENAVSRYHVGNPPGKDNKYGDAINWECLLNAIPNNEDVFFISGDKDYRSLFSNNEMNPFLVKEWNDKKHSNIHFYSSLSKFLDDHVKEIKLHDENEKQRLIDDLCESKNFQTTHGTIAMLKKYTGWTEQQVEKLCYALVNNSQVKWIIGDFDVYNFYHYLLSEIDEDNFKNEVVGKAMELVNDYDIPNDDDICFY